MKTSTIISGKIHIAIQEIKSYLKDAYLKLGLKDKHQAYHNFLKQSVMPGKKQRYMATS